MPTRGKVCQSAHALPTAPAATLGQVVLWQVRSLACANSCLGGIMSPYLVDRNATTSKALELQFFLLFYASLQVAHNQAPEKR